MRVGSWGKIVAYFDVVTDDGFAIRGFKIINGPKGQFVGNPNNRGGDGRYHDIAYPKKKGLREELRETAKKKYKDAVGRTSTNTKPVAQDAAFLTPEDNIF